LTIGKPGSFAFIEFDSIQYATSALETYDKQQIGNTEIHLSFAKRDYSSQQIQ